MPPRRLFSHAFLAGLVAVGCIQLAGAQDLRQSPDSPVVLVAEFHIAPGREDQFRTRALAFAKLAQAVPGVVYRLHMHPTESGRFIFYEFFPNQASLERVQNEVAARHRAENGPTPPGMFAKPPSEARWLPLN